VPSAVMVAPTAFTHVTIDLSDVLGSPGIHLDSRAVSDLESAVGGSWTLAEPARGALDGVLLSGRLTMPESAGVGAFAPVRRALTRRIIAPAAAGRRAGRAAGSADRLATLHSRTGRHEVWQQTVRGAPVLGAVYQTHQGPRGEVSFSGRPVGNLPERDPGPPPTVDARAVQAAMRVHQDLPKRTRIAVSPVVFPLDGRGIWAFKGECLLWRPIADLRIFVTAEDLSLLLSYDVTAASGTALGEGSAYRVSPARSPDPVSVVLHDLAPPPGDLLAGANLVVRPARGQPVTGRLGDHRVTPDTAGFNQVSAFHHCARALRWFTALLGDDLLAGPPFTPLTVLTDDMTVGAQVAVYVPATGGIQVHAARRNAARSADILFHEVTHAVADRIIRLGRSQFAESRCLGEGYADYVAASADDDPRFGDYVRNRPEGARNCSDPTLRFPPDLTGPGEPYTSGAVWAAALWDLRAAVGTAVADALVVNSLPHLTLNAGFADAVAALHQVDGILFSRADGTGRHVAEIDRAYEGRL
jgi:hypothetical protein